MHHRGLAVGVPVAIYGLSAFVFAQLSMAFWTVRGVLNVPGLLFMMGSLALVINFASGFLLQDLKARSDQAEVEEERVSITESAEPLIEQSATVEEGTQTELRDIASGMELFSNMDAYLLGVIMCTLVGVGLMYINNVGAVIKALIPTLAPSESAQASQNFQVGLLSIASFLGRLFSGYTSDVLYKMYSLDRLFWPFLSGIFILSGSTLAYLMTDIFTLSFVTFLIGFGYVFKRPFFYFSYGVIWTSTPVLVGEFFGVEKFASHWGFYQILPAIGGQVTSFVFGVVYDSEKKGHPSDPVCQGRDCFAHSFSFTIFLSIVSMVAVGVLYFKRRRVHCLHLQ